MTVELDYKIREWLINPFPLWNPTISSSMIHAIVPTINFKGYSIQQSLTGIYDSIQLLPLGNQQTFPLLELPSLSLAAFYDEHGLEPIQTSDAVLKINGALEELKLVEAAYMDVTLLVKTLQIIRSEQTDTDTSYSHPDIPFSIFVSLCEDDSTISNLRVAESILHEAMHLKLTIVERLVPLIESGSNATYFSPWREEERPARGVLHGLFVFCALFDFFKIIKLYKTTSKELDYVDNRISRIKKEINFLVDFPDCSSLTIYGKKLTKGLLYSALC